MTKNNAKTKVNAYQLYSTIISMIYQEWEKEFGERYKLIIGDPLRGFIMRKHAELSCAESDDILLQPIGVYERSANTFLYNELPSLYNAMGIFHEDVSIGRMYVNCFGINKKKSCIRAYGIINNMFLMEDCMAVHDKCPDELFEFYRLSIRHEIGHLKYDNMMIEFWARENEDMIVQKYNNRIECHMAELDAWEKKYTNKNGNIKRNLIKEGLMAYYDIRLEKKANQMMSVDTERLVDLTIKFDNLVRKVYNLPTIEF